MRAAKRFSSIIFLGSLLFVPATGFSQDEMPYYLQDRGTGIPMSLFGTYINEGETIIYPFYEYYYDQNAEYKPQELGYGLNEDFRGKYRAHEALIFLGYGVSDKVALEFEAAVITATQYKSDDDPSSMPDKLKQSGLGDVEGQVRWRWSKETIKRPELFSYFETVFPIQTEKKLIGTEDWEFKLGLGAIKGFHWGTMTVRAAVEYDAAESKSELGEYAVEYLKRLSDFFRYYVGIEGSQDEVEFIVDLQFHVTEHAFIRVNNSFGVTSKATDYAPELGVLFHF